MKKTFRFGTVFACVLFSALLVACSSGVSQSEYDKVVAERDELKEQLAVISPKNNASHPEPAENNSPEPDNKTAYGFGEPFEFDGVQVTFGEDIKWSVLSDYFVETGEYGDGVVFGVPVHVKNTTNETYSLPVFYFKVFEPLGTQPEDVDALMDDDALWTMGDLRAGAENERYLYILYSGDGEYVVECRTVEKTTEVAFNVTKP